MLKLLIRLLCVGLVLALSFAVLSVTTGGKWFRRAGDALERKGEQAGDAADSIKQMTDGAAEKTKGTIQKAKDAGEKIKDVAGEAVGKIKNAAN